MEPQTDQPDALAAAQRIEDRTRLAPEGGVAQGVPAGTRARRGRGNAAWLGFLGPPLPIGAVQAPWRHQRDHLAGIVEHFRSGLDNGFVEAMNAQIQAAKARAKGYATTTNMIAIAYLLCAKLRHLPPNPWLAPASA